MNTARLPLSSLFSILAAMLIVGCQPTPVSPTATVRPLATATATFPPEIVATQPSDVAGVWRISYKGVSESFRADLTLREDSTFLFENAAEKSPIFEGIMRFADGKVTLDSDACFDPLTGLEPCKMVFIIHSSMQDGQPVRIRFESVDEKKRRFSTNFNGKALLPAAP